MPYRYLLALLLAFALLAAVYSLTTPLFEAPDEPWHYAYVRWLAEGHGLPRLDDNTSGAYQEVAQPPLYYVVAALFSAPVTDHDLSELFWHNPHFGYQAGGTVNDNKNMLIHTDRERFPWQGAVLAVRLARSTTLVFGLLTLIATYGLAREAFPDHPALILFAASVVAFTPQFLFISGVVSNDSATAAVCTCALWVLARIVRAGPTLRRAVVAGLALGLAALSKTSALALLPMALLALKIGARRTHKGYPWREAAVTLGLAGIVGGWWYARNWILFHDPLGLSVHVNTPWGRTESVGLMQLLSELPQVFRSFWGAFGWGHVELHGYLYAALAVLTGLVALGWMRHLARYTRWALTRHRSRPAAAVIESASGSLASADIGILSLTAGWCLIVFLALLRWMQQVGAPHGRLLFPALGAWGLLSAAGWAGLSPSYPAPPRALHSTGSPSATPDAARGPIPRLLFFIPVASLFLLSLIAPFAIIRPAFVSPSLLSSAEAEKRVTTRTVSYDDQARLLGFRVEPESIAAGERIQVTLCWEALRPMNQDFTLFIHLLGRDNLRVAERTTYPGQGRFPTTLWPTGSVFCDSYWLKVAPWAPAPELYALEIGLYDAATGRRLLARDPSGEPIEPPAIGLVRVVPAAPLPRPAHSLAYDLGGEIALVGFDSSPEFAYENLTALTSGETLTLTLYWQALQVPKGNYKVFVHLLDETGAIVAQDDAPPRGGRYPTWSWQPGDLVPDPHPVTLPQESSPGSYHWSVGMYHPDTRVRLPVTGPQGPLPNDAIPLGEKPD